MAEQQTPPEQLPSRRDAQLPEEQRRVVADDEISLIDLWLVLSRRRWWLLGIALAVTIVGSLYAAFLEAEQEYTTILRLAAESSHSEPFVTVSSLQERFNNVALPRLERDFEAEHEGNAPPIDLTQIEGASTLMLVSTTPAARAEHVEDLHQGASDWLIKAQQEAFRREVQQKEQSIERLSQELEEERAAIDTDIERTRKALEEARDYLSEIRATRDRLSEQLNSEDSRGNIGTSDTNSDDMASILQSRILQTRLEANREDFALARDEVRNLEERISELRSKRRTMERKLERERENLQRQLDRLQAPQALEIAATGAEQGSPKRLIVALSGVLGLMLGVFGAFFREFLAHVQQVTSGEAHPLGS